MKKLLRLCLFLCLASAPTVYAQMSDSQIIAYVQQGLKAGKSQTQIGQELLAKGVPTSQIQRLMQQHGNGNATTALPGGGSQAERTTLKSRMRQSQIDTTQIFKEKDEDGLLLPPKDSIKNRKIAADDIFGHNLFSNKSELTFEPNVNSATPKDYVIGPEDEIIIDVWGASEATIQATVSPEGQIFIEQVGPVHLSGLTIDQATKKLRSALSAKYSIMGPEADSQMSVTLGNIRTIHVNVLGEVKAPGTYRLSAFSTAFNALYYAGGITQIGSLRTIRIVRAGKTVSTVDLYKFLFDGSNEGNISLKDNDAIIVPPYAALVEVTGGVKRPMYYESVPGESVGKVIEYAGGFAFDANPSELTIQRRDGIGGKVFTIASTDFASFGMQDGDKVEALTNQQEDLFDNKAEIQGSVLRPGVYALGGEIATLRQLVEHAGGLLDDSFLSRAQILREKPDRSMELKSVAIGAIMSGKADDIILRKNDLIMVGNVNEMEPKGDLTITGYVINPGEYEFAEGMSVEDLIMLAGGLDNGASTARVDVSRRIDVSNSTEASETLAEVFSFTIHEGLLLEGSPDFTLKPFDIVSVRKSPTYVAQKQVLVSGEVTFPGEYTLISNNERLSSLFKRAGGNTPNAYVKGAILKRKFTNAEMEARKNLMKTAETEADSLNINQMAMEETFNVGINLDKAIAFPGSEYDLVLASGDELVVPAETNTVRIQGEVFSPNAVNYIPGKPISFYISQAGGFNNDARKSKVYVAYMNGKMSRGMNAKVEPGCDIVVPARAERHKMTVGEWLGIGTTAASLTTMIATISNLLKK